MLLQQIGTFDHNEKFVIIRISVKLPKCMYSHHKSQKSLILIEKAHRFGYKFA